MTFEEEVEMEYISREELLKRRYGCGEDCTSCAFVSDGDSWCRGRLYIVNVLREKAADVRHVGELSQMIDEAINATSMNDTYSIGVRNGLRCARAFLDGKAPEYEKAKNN